MGMLRMAKQLRRRYGTTDPEQILRAMGVTVIRIPLQGLRGIYKRIESNVIVFVDSELDSRTERFVLGHELGHHILHKGLNRVFLERCTHMKTSVYEREADLFSVCLMAPDPEDVLEEGCTVETIAARLGVERRLAELYAEESKRAF